MQEKSNNSRNVPNLRFPGFAGEWRKERLGKACVINPSNDHLPNSFTYIDLESVVNGRLLKKTIISKREAPSRAQRILKREDILFQMVRPYQKNNYYFDLDGNYVASTGYAQIRTKHNPQFVFQYLHQQQFVDKVIKRCTGTSYPAINSTDLSNISISMPLLDEQEKVGSLLSRIDQRIDTQSQIINQLESLKKGLCKKIFSQEIRFKDENGNYFFKWNKTLLREIAHRITTKNDENNQNVLTISAQQGLISQNDFFHKSVSSKNLKGYYLLHKNEFAYNKSYSIGYPMGAIKRLKYYEKGIVSTLYICFQLKKGIDISFIEQYFESGNHIAELQKIAQEGARNHGLLNIALEDFFSIKLKIPEHQEQSKIANFLSSIDKKIETEKQLLKQYEKQKKYLLQNLFI